MHNQDKFVHSLPSVTFLVGMVFFVIFPRLLISPLLIRIADSLSITYDCASVLFLTASVGFVSGLFVSGFVAQRLNHRWTIIGSVAIAGLSLLVLSGVKSLWAFHTVLFVGSLANGLYPGSGIAAVTALVPDRHRGKALAMHESGPNLAFIIAPILAALLAPIGGWRLVFAVTGAASLVAASLFALFGHSTDEPGQPPHFNNMKVFLRSGKFWTLTFLFTIVGCAAIGVYSVLPTYLIIEHGYGESFINTLVGVSRISGFVSIFIAGSLTDRFGFRKITIAIMGITGFLTVLIGATAGIPLIIVVLLQPMAMQAFFPVAISALTTIGPLKARNLSISLAISLVNIVGSGISPWVFGALGAAGLFRLGFIVLGVIVLVSPLLTLKVNLD